MSGARFLLRPKWLLSHLLVVALVVTMVNLGFWQLRRLDERRDRNELVESRMGQPAVAVDELLAPDDGDAAVEEARFRAVTATGTYQADETVPVRNRSQDGVAGGWLVTPIELAGGERVGVIRGFVGFTADGAIQTPPPPSGEVTVSGIVVDPDRLGGTASKDVAPLLEETGMLPGLVVASSSDPPEPAAGPASAADAVAPTDPAAGDRPPGDTATGNTATGPAADRAGIVPVAPPELGEGPHLSYAVQWFIFSTIGLVGYPLVLRRVVIRRGKEVDDADDGSDGTGPVDDLDRELEELLRQGH